jgi:hypothetical protein
MTVYENIASPLRVPARASGDDRSRSAQGGRAAEAGRPISTARRSTVRRPAAAHRACPRHRQECAEPRAARRAARQSRLQAARGIARRAAEDLRRLRRDLRLCDDRALRSAAARRQHRDAVAKAASPSSAATIEVYRKPIRPVTRAPSPIRRSTRAGRKEGGDGSSSRKGGGRAAGHPAHLEGSPTAPTPSASSRITSGAGRRQQWPHRERAKVTASPKSPARKASSTSNSAQPLGHAGRMASTISSRTGSSTGARHAPPDGLRGSDGRLVAAPAAA